MSKEELLKLRKAVDILQKQNKHLLVTIHSLKSMTTSVGNTYNSIQAKIDSLLSLSQPESKDTEVVESEN